MSAPAIAVPRADGLESLLARLPRQPAEGWASLVAAAVMAMAYATSLRDAGWIPGREGDTDYLPYLALMGVLVGFASAKVRWGRFRTHLIGATLAGLLVPLIMGGVVLGGELGFGPQDLARRLGAATQIANLVWIDLAVQGRPFTTQIAHFHLVFGAMVWAAGQLAGYTIFGHRRPFDAIVVVGLLLLGNMALTSRGDEQLPILVVFSGAALVLLIRSHVFEEQVAWTRRRIGDPATVGRLYLRGGAIFVTLAVVGSLLLTSTASSAPLQDLWRDLPAKLVAMSEWFQRIAPPGGAFRNPGAVSFGSNAVTTGVWQPSDQVAFRAQFEPSERRVAKWRAGTYSIHTTFGWAWGETTEEPTAARDTILAGAADEPSQVGRRQLRVAVMVEGFREAVVSPQTILSVDVPTTARMVGTEGWFTVVEAGGNPAGYNVLAMVPVFQDVQGGITEARLRAAGTDYPAELVELYTALPPDSLGDAARSLLDEIRGLVNAPPDVDPDNPYDLARTMETFLRDERNFRYDTDVRDLVRDLCAGASDIECFARTRAGYCVQYSGLMTGLLRESGIPARIAYGFLPGERDSTGLEIVGGWTQHWWVEAYFPGIGWVEFDPTGGGVGLPQPIPSGSVGPPTPRPSVPGATQPAEPSEPPGGGGVLNPQGPGRDIGPFVAIAIILAIGLIALAMAALRRAPRRPMHPDNAWGGLARWASRLGLGPRPSQTVYEYAGALGDALPAARTELTTLARAKVEVAYGRRDLESDRLRMIAQAYQRLRVAMLSFAIRRGLRRPGRRGPTETRKTR